jgi:hypothetical protein
MITYITGKQTVSYHNYLIITSNNNIKMYHLYTTLHAALASDILNSHLFVKPVGEFTFYFETDR